MCDMSDFLYILNVCSLFTKRVAFYLYYSNNVKQFLVYFSSNFNCYPVKLSEKLINCSLIYFCVGVPLPFSACNLVLICCCTFLLVGLPPKLLASAATAIIFTNGVLCFNEKLCSLLDPITWILSSYVSQPVTWLISIFLGERNRCVWVIMFFFPLVFDIGLITQDSIFWVLNWLCGYRSLPRSDPSWISLYSSTPNKVWRLSSVPQLSTCLAFISPDCISSFYFPSLLIYAESELGTLSLVGRRGCCGLIYTIL